MIRLLAVCPFLAAINRESLKTDKILEKLVFEVENGYPRLEKVGLKLSRYRLLVLKKLSTRPSRCNFLAALLFTASL
jgi:hypothetical protein